VDTQVRWPTWLVARVVLAVMGAAAAAGLTFALVTQQFRRDRDRPKDGPTRPEAVLRPVAPSELAALGYLPGDTNLIVAVHVAEALREPAGREWLERFRLGPMDFGIDSVEKWTGLRWDELDHVVLGLRVDNRLVPRLTLVAQTSRPYDAEKVRNALKAKRLPDPGKRTLWGFRLEQPALQGVLWFAGERTLIVGLSAKDLEGIPPTPMVGPDHLSEELRGLLKERVGRVAQAWVVGHAEEWSKTVAGLVLNTLAKPDREALAKVQSFGAWVQVDEAMTVNGAFRCMDEAAAQALEAYLRQPKTKDSKPLPFFRAQPGAEVLAQQVAETLNCNHKDDWVTLQARVKPEVIRQAPALPEHRP
jgi:hypothetical protein